MESEIRKNRMTDVTINVLQADGAPLSTQEVIIEQTRHQFLFGTAAFDLIPLSNGGYEGKAKEQAEERAEKLTALFNAATLPFYWARFEPERGKPLTEETKRAAQWCREHNLLVKGHPLCWHTLTADWLLSMSNSEILQAQLGRIRRDVSDFRGLIDMWDVINEAVIMPIFDKYDNGITRLCWEKGRINTIRAMFEAARPENPSATLLINDFDVSPAYDILVEGCLEAEIKIDVIGIQSHMHQGYWGVEKTLKVLDQFTRFGLPIHFTETTLVSGTLMPPEIIDLNDYHIRWRTGRPRRKVKNVRRRRRSNTTKRSLRIPWWKASPGGICPMAAG